MSAAEIIQQIKELPTEELQIVIEFFGEAESRRARVMYVDDATAKAASDNVLKVHAELFRRLAADERAEHERPTVQFGENEPPRAAGDSVDKE